MSFLFRPMDETSARAIVSWRYEEPYSLYNISPDATERSVQAFLDPRNAYYRISHKNEDLAAYCCFGPDAQVPGGDYRAKALDIGMGVHPDLTGQGLGLSYAQAVLDFAHPLFAPPAFRVTVAEFNKRALRVWEKANFQPVQAFLRDTDGMAFVVLINTLE